MKRFTLILITVLLATAGLYAQDNFFEKFADRQGVTSVYISKKMFGMMKNIDTGDVNLSNLAGKINSLQLLSCENREVAAEIRKETAHIRQHNGYEELMRIKDEGDRIVVYVKEGKKENEYVLLIDGTDEFTLIQLNGQLTLEELQNAVKH